jgi:Peptidase_C39 like family
MGARRQRDFLRAGIIAVVALGLGMTTAMAPATATVQLGTAQDAAKGGADVRNITYREWTSDADFATGASDGVAVGAGSLTIGSAAGTTTYTDPFGTAGPRSYDFATWTSPTVAGGFAATEAVPSWNATTPGGTWLQVDLRGTTEAGTTTKWYILGRWAAGDTEIHRTSVSLQGDADGFIAIDTFVAADGHALTSYQLRVTLYRPAATTETPTLRSVGAMASALPAPKRKPVVAPGTGVARTLAVPQYSQEIHIGEYPEFDGGGEAWCSPTSTSMVLSYWGSGPTEDDYAWVDPSFADPWVDHAARMTYDYNYQGAGNWPFNTAYASTFGMDGFVTRLRSMDEVEQFIGAGIPLVLSLAMKKNEVPGAGYSTNGHLLVVVGFTADGDAVINDPFAPTNADVRKVFSRAEFENAWLNTSGGIVYVMRPAGRALPPAPAQANW